MNDKNTILIIDDNDEFRMASAALLAGAGHRVVEAADAVQARAQFERMGRMVDVVVTDVNMPGTDGITLVAELRRFVPRLPVLFISSHVDARLGRRLAAGDVAFLAKPFGPASLSKSLERARSVAARAVAATPLGSSADSRPSARRGPFVWLAAAAAVILSIGVATELSRDRAPDLPDIAPSGITRALAVEPLYPLGSLLTRPATLSWRPIERADSYRVEIRRIGYDLVYQTTVKRSTVSLPETVRAAFEPGVDFTWRVEALAGGQQLAFSQKVRFRLSLPKRHGDATDLEPLVEGRDRSKGSDQ